MPGLDRTGPLGRGRRSGRGLGICRGAYGYGRGLFRGVYKVEDKEIMQEEKEYLERRLKELNEELDK